MRLFFAELVKNGELTLIAETVEAEEPNAGRIREEDIISIDDTISEIMRVSVKINLKDFNATCLSMGLDRCHFFSSDTQFFHKNSKGKVSAFFESSKGFAVFNSIKP